MGDSKRQNGFTLVELQITMVIIGLLAAIAIPIFLAQREKGWRAQTQSALKNAAIAEEAWITDNRDYTADIGLLSEAEGLRVTPEVDLAVPVTDAANAYCIQAKHAILGETWHYSSAIGKPSPGGCP